MKKKPWNSVISSVWQRTLVFSIIMTTKKTKDWSRTSIGEHVYQLNVTVRHITLLGSPHVVRYGLRRDFPQTLGIPCVAFVLTSLCEVAIYLPQGCVLSITPQCCCLLASLHIWLC